MGNMNRTDPASRAVTLAPRHQLAFTLGVIQWPHIQPRDAQDTRDGVDSVQKIIVGAGLAHLESIINHTSSDGIYDLYALRRSEE